MCGVTKIIFAPLGIIHWVKSTVLVSYGSTPERNATSQLPQSS